MERAKERIKTEERMYSIILVTNAIFAIDKAISHEIADIEKTTKDIKEVRIIKL